MDIHINGQEFAADLDVFKQAGCESALVLEKELEFSCTGAEYALITPGDYEVVFVKAVPLRQWGNLKIILWFRVIQPGDWVGKEIFMACNGSDGKTLSCGTLIEETFSSPKFQGRPPSSKN